MANLVYYCKENDAFPDAFKKCLTKETAEIVFKKLCRHFKLRRIYLEWTSGRNHPKAFSLSGKIILNEDWNNFGVLCHELAHIKHREKYGFDFRPHTKKHWRIMKSMIAYCTKKNWFQEELTRRTGVIEVGKLV